jgi:hypothetical protein
MVKMYVKTPSNDGMMPKSIIRDAIAIRMNKMANPGRGFWDLKNRNKKIGAIQAANETHHLPFEKINNEIPANSSKYGVIRLYFSLAGFIS